LGGAKPRRHRHNQCDADGYYQMRQRIGLFPPQTHLKGYWAMAGFEISAEGNSKETGLDGVRHSCESGWDTNTAPEGHVINPHVS